MVIVFDYLFNFGIGLKKINFGILKIIDVNL